MPGADLDLQDGQTAIEVLNKGTELILGHPLRTGNVIDLPRFDTPGAGRFVVTGDLHDNANNFARIIKFANLGASEDHYVVFHEMTHGDRLINGVDLSAMTLIRVAALMTEYPGQVLTILSNHDLAQYLGEGITKGGRSVVEACDEGIDYLFDDDADGVRDALNSFIRAMPMAIRCGNGVFVSHSLPAPRMIEKFDPEVLNRPYTDADLHGPFGSAYMMVWGRNQSDKIVEELMEPLGGKVFIVGHQPAEMGWRPEGEHILIINSDHMHGCAIAVDLAESYDQEKLIELIRPLNSVML